MAAGDLVGDDLDTILDQYGAQKLDVRPFNGISRRRKGQLAQSEQPQKTTKLSGSLSRGFHDEIGTVRTMVVPRPAAVWISNAPSICEALVRMLRNPKPSLFSRLALEIPDPLSFT
jgi:hypothetical protein